VKPEEWVRARDIFDAALERAPADRAVFLDQACHENVMLRQEVASLLEAHERSGDFIEHRAFAVAPGLIIDAEGSREGRQLGPYILRHEIGRGGMGVVYLADDTRLARRVALKVLPADAARDPARRELLRREARAAAALSHPGIATVYALDEIGDELCFTCEYVAGPTLRGLIESGPVPIAQVVDIAAQLGRALAAAHAQGVVHRDLKPENIVWTTAGVAKILDFGIAQVESLPARLTNPAAAAGTPAYMAPEQIRGHDTDFRVDLFAFGSVVYELCAGTNPFDERTRTTTLSRVLEFDPPALSFLRPDAPPALERIVTTCLQKDPAQRYASTRALVSDIDHLQSDFEATSRLSAAGRTGSGRQSAARSWWELHQGIVSAINVLMMYPAWRVRVWLPAPWGTIFLLAVLACAAAATTLRLHVWFTARQHPDDLRMADTQARRWIQWCEAALSVILVLAAIEIGPRHQAIAMLFVTVGVATLIAARVIEPATSRAALTADSSVHGARRSA
jgi:serine/threonine-protein kinase